MPNKESKGSGFRSPDLSNYRTLVKEPTPGGGVGDTGGGGDGYKQQALPSPPWQRSKPFGKPEYNGPGPSGTGPDGKSIHKDKARTQGVPGKPHPHPEPRIGPVRRPEVMAGDEKFEASWFARLPEENETPLVEGPELVVGAINGPNYPGAKRQREQKGPAKNYYRKYYTKHKSKIRVRMKKWYLKMKNRGTFKKDQERRDKHPEKFERRPGGGVTQNKDRAKEWRGKQKKKASLPIPVFFLPDQEWGWFTEADPETGTLFLEVGGDLVGLPMEVFFEEVIPAEEDLDLLFTYLDSVFEEEEEMGSLEKLEKLALSVVLKSVPIVRQKKQKGEDKLKTRMQYLKTRAQSRLKSRKRYKLLRKNPTFKNMQKIRRKHPERFKRKHGSVLTAPEITFVLGEGMVGGVVHNVSPMTGLVTYYRISEEPLTAKLESMPVADFLESVGFLSEYDADMFFELVDVEVGLEAYKEPSKEALENGALLESNGVALDDLVSTPDVNRFVYNHDSLPRSRSRVPSEADPYMIDPTDDDYIFGQVNVLEDYIPTATERVASLWAVKQAEMLYERDDRPFDPEAYYSRADSRVDRKEVRKPLEKRDQPYVPENPGSAKVIPWNSDLVNNKAAARMREIVEGCDASLRERSRGVQARLRRVDARNAIWHFDVQGSDEAHHVRVKALRRGNVRDVSKVDVQVSCSCPFWQWQGPEHWAQQGEYLFGSPRGTASRPVMKDPKATHRACKHIIASFDFILSRNWQVPEPHRKQGAVEQVTARYSKRTEE